jgi:Cu/Ag efflux protein CusF
VTGSGIQPENPNSPTRQSRDTSPFTRFWENDMVRRSFVLLAAVAFAFFATPAFAEDVKPGTHEGKVVKAADGKLTMTDKANKEHTHAIGADVKITIEGKEAKLEDLKAGTTVKVTAEKKDDKVVVTKIESDGK